MKSIYFVIIVCLMSCTKEPDSIVGTWTLTNATWDGAGSGTVNGHLEMTFTSSGNYLYNSNQTGTYIESGQYLILDGQSYRYHVNKKTLILYHWYRFNSEISFPNLVMYFSK